MTRCGKCNKERARKNKPYALCEEHRKKYFHDWRRGNKEKVLATKQKYHAKLKFDVISHYGGKNPKCKCCNEKNLAFLTIDHINGNGKEHRKQIRKMIYSWLKLQNYPKGFQVLCFNCNCGRSINKGICPHKLQKKGNYEEERLLSTQKKEMIKKIMNDEELWEYLRNPIHISVKNRIEYVLQKMKEGE